MATLLGIGTPYTATTKFTDEYASSKLGNKTAIYHGDRHVLIANSFRLRSIKREMP